MQQPQGWYPDPAGDPQRLRWWTGETWTDDTTPRPGSPMAVAKRRRVWPWVLGAVGGVVVLLGIGAAIYVPRIVDTFKGPVDAANVYLRAQRDGRLDAAYDELCSELRNQATYEQYLQRISSEEQQGGRVLKFNANRASSEFGHSDEAVVDVNVTTTRGRDAIQARMRKELGHWRWCGSRPTPKSTGIFIHFP